MSTDHIIVGQKVDPAKQALAKELRSRMTEAERLLWQALRRNQLGGLHFRRQQVIDGFIVDFYCHAARLVVEVDGPIHQDQAQYDAQRDQAMADRRLRVLRVQNADVLNNLPSVLARIRHLADLTYLPIPTLT